MKTDISRREALKKTILFSTGLLTASWLPRTQAATPVTQFSEEGLQLLAFGDYGSKNKSQELVAKQMARFARQLGRPPFPPHDGQDRSDLVDGRLHLGGRAGQATTEVALHSSQVKPL